MPKMQFLSAFVELGGDPRNVAAVESISYAEMHVLKAIHGGEHVHTLVEVGRVETHVASERERLALKYGSVVDKLFPFNPTGTNLPLSDDSIPTAEDVAVATAAAEKAMAASRTKTKAKQAKAEAAAPVETYVEPEPATDMPDLTS